MNRTWLAMTVVTLQFCYLVGFAWFESQRLLPGRGQSILVRTAPVDPRDLLRGQYMRLQYRFTRSPSNFEVEPRDTVWVVLRPKQIDGQRFHEPVLHSTTRPENLEPDDVVIRGQAKSYGRILFGIEKYFVKFGTETPDPQDVTVRLRVGNDHRPRIENVYVRGANWP